MKYARSVNGRVVDAVTIPDPLPSWAQDALAFLAKMFPGVTGWQLANDDTENGDIDNGDGTFTKPELSPIGPPRPNKNIYRAVVRNRAAVLATRGEELKSLLLLKTIGE